MKTLADLDRTHRTIPSHVIRQMTGDRIGQYPHSYLWRDMRRCAGIQPQQRKLTQLEAIRLIAVTVTWQETGQLPQSLVQVNRLASELLEGRGLEDMFSALQERKLSAAELKEAIARMTGKKPCNRTLYRWGEKYGIRFSTRRQYTPEQAKRFISLACQK
jgi:hypothetical protein